MESLNSKISFNIRFLFTGTPSILLTVESTLTLLEQEQLRGYFEIVQPDGIASIGAYIGPEIYWSGSGLTTFTYTLRLGTDQLYQRGDYRITFSGDHPDYTPGQFTRSFNMQYKPVSQVINESFDLYTPLLKYIDQTQYQKAGFTILSQTALWNVTTTAGVIPTSTLSYIDLAIGGDYYDSSYNCAYNKNVIYQHETDTWLSVSQNWIYDKTTNAYTPQSMVTLLSYLDNLKTKKDARSCSDSLNALYEKAAVLYQHIRSKVCAQSTTGLKDYFDEFYRLTHNYQNYVYANTGAVIPAYDFTTGCGGSGGGALLNYSLRVTPGVSTFTIDALAGKTIITATRSGFSKGITSSPTTDTEFLQIVSNVVSLPTGDEVASVTLPDLSVTGELFTFTYQ